VFIRVKDGKITSHTVKLYYKVRGIEILRKYSNN
jgi:Ni,Fe-hydrogenase III large subunit